MAVTFIKQFLDHVISGPLKLWISCLFGKLFKSIMVYGNQEGKKVYSLNRFSYSIELNPPVLFGTIYVMTFLFVGTS